MVASLTTDVHRLLAASVSDNTQRIYQAGTAAYRRFCNNWQISQTPATVQGLCLFAASLRMAGLTADTAQVYLAAVRNAHLRLGLDTTIFRNTRLTAIVQGLQRSQLQGTAAGCP